MKAARKLFAKKGYAGVGTEEVVKKAGVTRGALYHQFADKRDLFRAVFEAVESDATQHAVARAGQAGDPLGELHEGVRQWLDYCFDPEVRRIVLIDGPSVLGFVEWREILSRYGLGLIAGALQFAMDEGAIARQPVMPLAHVLSGALNYAALYMTEADDPEAARKDMETVLGRLVDTLKPSSPRS